VAPMTDTPTVFDRGADTPHFTPVAAIDSVAGLLASLDVVDASEEDQRAAVLRASKIATLAPLIEPLIPDLQKRGLLD
jgi:hypothetical protein